MKLKGPMTGSDDIVWKIALFVICGGVIGYGSTYSQFATGNLAELLGYTIPIALILWGIYYLLVARRRGDKVTVTVAIFSFLIIYVSLIASGLFMGGAHYKQETNSKRQAEISEIRRFMKEQMNQTLSLRDDYVLELETIGWKGILDFNRIKADKTFTESRDLIKKVREATKKYRERLDGLSRNVNNNIRSLNISESSKRIMIAGSNDGREKNKKNMETTWRLKAKIFRESEDIINFLSARNGKWIVENGGIVFHNQGDTDKYNSYISSIQNTGRQLEAVQRQARQFFNRSYEQFMR